MTPEDFRSKVIITKKAEKMTLARLSIIAGLVVAGISIASAAAVYNPFVLKSEQEPLIELIGGDLINNAYLRRGQLEQALYIALGEAEKERKDTGKVSERTQERIVSLKQSIAVLGDKIQKYKKEFRQ